MNQFFQEERISIWTGESNRYFFSVPAEARPDFNALGSALQEVLEDRGPGYHTSLEVSYGSLRLNNLDFDVRMSYDSRLSALEVRVTANPSLTVLDCSCLITDINGIIPLLRSEP
ncbi:MAG: hypothetical protein AABX70_03480 [Nanoarchaeota archaeon]